MKIVSPVHLKQDSLKKNLEKKKEECVFKISRSLFIQCVGEKECHSPIFTGEVWLKFTES